MSAGGRVVIIGAGPGDPGLVTVRGARLLSQADVVIYDRAAEPVLRWASPDAERIDAGGPAERDVAQDAISMLLAEKVRDGHTVARLKWGDPFVFDSGAKEAMFLHEQGIPFEVVPGVPAVLGASAYAGIPLTHPSAGDSLLLIRGSEGTNGDEEGPAVEWPAAAALDGTLCCWATPRLATLVLQQLIDQGRSIDEAAAVIYRGTKPSQQTIAGTIGSLLEVLAAGEAPAEAGWLLVGDVVNLREHARWFDERPLFGKRIIITRSVDRARELSDPLENLGAESIVAPTFRITAPDDPEAVDRIAASVDRFDWIVFESAVSAARLLTAIARGPRDMRALGRANLCAVGPSTADQLTAYGLKADVVIPEVRVEGVADAMSARAPIDGRTVLVVRPDHERSVMADALSEHGGSVTDLVAYKTDADTPDSPAAQRIYRLLLDGQVDAVTFTSPTAVKRFAAIIGEEQAADLLGMTIVATIGPVTAAAALELGINPTIVADPFTVDGLVQALVRHFQENT